MIHINIWKLVLKTYCRSKNNDWSPSEEVGRAAQDLDINYYESNVNDPGYTWGKKQRIIPERSIASTGLVEIAPLYKKLLMNKIIIVQSKTFINVEQSQNQRGQTNNGNLEI